MTFQDILNRYENPKKQGNGYMVNCKAHDDKKRSLKLTEADDGKTLVYCHAGCTVEDIAESIELETRDLFPDNGYKLKEQPIECNYTDENSKLLYQSLRYPGKNFKQRQPDGKGGWIYNLRDIKRVPYNLPIVIATIKAKQHVFIVEGEKDADKLMSLGLTATTNSGGAGKWLNSFRDYFIGAKVVIIPDNDQPGKEHALKVANSLYGKAEAIKIVNLPKLNEKEDISDWLNAGNTKEDLINLVKDTEQWQPQKEQNNMGVLMSDVKLETVNWLWNGRIALSKLNLIDGDPGQGKSTLSLDIASRVSTGNAMPGCTEIREPAGVVILSAEDGLADTIKPRLIAARADCRRILALTTLKDTEIDEERPFVLPDDLNIIQEATKQVNAKLLIIDPLMAFLSGNVNSHRDQDIRRVLHLLANLAEDTGVAVVAIRHLNKSNTTNSLYRGGGSIGIIGAARSGLLVAVNPDDENKRVMASTKCNLAKKPDSLSFYLEDCNGTSKIVWEGVSSYNANTLLATNDEQGVLEEAKNILTDILRDKAIPASDVITKAKNAGVSKRTLDRAKADLKVKSIKKGNCWLWELPKNAKSINDNLGNVGNLPQEPGETLDYIKQGCQERQDSFNRNVGNLDSKTKKFKQEIIKEFNATELS